MSLMRPIAATLFRAAVSPVRRLHRPLNPSVIVLSADPLPRQPPYPPSAGCRSKHSATQVKRLFKKNPARLRIVKKNGKSDPRPHIPDRIYPPVFKPTFLGNGWSAPPPSEVAVPEYPFQVRRTGRKPFGAVGFLPVYRDVRIHGTKRTTIIRNVSGDVHAFLKELRAVLQLPLGKRGVLTSASTGKHGGGEAGRGVNAESPLRIRTGGVIEVNGDRAKEVRNWLASLGF